MPERPPLDPAIFGGNVVALAPRTPFRPPAPAAARAPMPQAASGLERLIEANGELAVLAVRRVGEMATPMGAFELWCSLARRSVEAGMVLTLAFTGVGASLVRAGLEPLQRTLVRHDA